MPEILCGFVDGPKGSGQELLTGFGPTLMVQIGFDPNHRHDAKTAPALAANKYPALVDTGATESCIDSTLASALKLPIVDRETRAGVHGNLELDIHLAQIHVSELAWTITGRFAGVHLHAGGQPHFALIGRTFLRACTLIYEGKTGSVTIRRE